MIKPQCPMERLRVETIARSRCFRYVVNISFKGFSEVGFKKVENIAEPVKTLKEAQEYKALVDDTVAKACIVDRVTGKVVEWWVQ